MTAAMTRVILDCDTANEIDDQFAIAHALGSPQLNVLGIVSVQNTVIHGSDSVTRYVEEATRVAAACGRADLPCLAGASHPMEAPDQAVPSEGLDFIIEMARQEEVTVLATGPATDIASLAVADGDVRDDVKVIWAGGFPDLDTWITNRFGELNARADIQAWRGLYNSDLDLSILPGWPGVEKVRVEYEPTIQRLRGLGSAIGRLLADLLQDWGDTRAGVSDMDRTRDGLKVLWDIVNVAAVTCPKAVTWQSQPLPRLDAAGAPEYSDTVRTAPMGLDVDAERVLDDLWAALANLTHV